MRRVAPAIVTIGLAMIATASTSTAEETPATGKAVRRPRDSWTLQVGLAHSAADDNHYAVSGFQARFPIYTLDRKGKGDRLGSIGLGVGGHPYPVIWRGDRGAVPFAAAVLMYKGVGARVEWAQLNTRGSRVNASGWRFGITAR